MREPFVWYEPSEELIGSLEGTEQLVPLIKQVVEDIDTLTFNRISDFSSLTAFQKKVLVEAADRFLTFKRDNGELLSSIVRSYSISGVSLSFDNASVMCESGVYVPGDVYALLRQTGLTCRLL